MTVLDDLKRLWKGKQVDPWEDYDPDAPLKPKPTEADLVEAVEEAYKPKPRPKYTLLAKQGFMLLWILGHIVPLYVSIGTPIAAGILVYVLVNTVIFMHYYILLRKKSEKHE